MNKLMRLRYLADISQRQLSRESGVDVRKIRRWEYEEGSTAADIEALLTVLLRNAQFVPGSARHGR